jgi:hypothetical protein
VCDAVSAKALRLRKNALKVYLACLLVLHCCLLVHAAWVQSPTVDEPTHLRAGIAILSERNFSYNPGNPPLANAIAAIPTLILCPDIDVRRADWSGGSELCARGMTIVELIRFGRCALIPFSVLGALTCFQWAKALYGPGSGAVAVTLWCSCPMVLGHGALMTCDVAAAALGVYALYALWLWLSAATWKNACVMGAALGVAMVSKFVWLVLIYIVPSLWVLWFMSSSARGLRTGGRHIAQLSLAAAIAIVCINVSYAFQEVGCRLVDFPRFAASIGVQDVPLVSSIWIPLPAQFIRGPQAIQEVLDRPVRSYLAGEWRQGGWWYYYFYAALVKVPVGTMILTSGAILSHVLHRDAKVLRRESVLLLPCAVIIGVLCTLSNISHHFRYALPILPLMFIVASRSAAIAMWPERLKVVIAPCVVVALTLSVISSATVFPHSVSYFNWLSGGPPNGPSHLLDSNIDWGQDLLLLSRWQKSRPDAADLKLLYFGSIDPAIAGITFTCPPRCSENLEPGWYAVSVNCLYGLESSVPDGAGGWKVIDSQYCSALRRMEPRERVGYSILIYYVAGRNCSSGDLRNANVLLKSDRFRQVRREL